MWFAPGLVTRSVLYSMFAINTRLRLLLPDLARSLLEETYANGATIRWPSDLTLKVGRTPAWDADRGLIAEPVFMMRVLTDRQMHHPYVDIVFPHLLVAHRQARRRGRILSGSPATSHLPGAETWLPFGPGRTNVDFHNLTRALPAFTHPLLTASDEWVEIYPERGPSIQR